MSWRKKSLHRGLPQSARTSLNVGVMVSRHSNVADPLKNNSLYLDQSFKFGTELVRDIAVKT